MTNAETTMIATVEEPVAPAKKVANPKKSAPKAKKTAKAALPKKEAKATKKTPKPAAERTNKKAEVIAMMKRAKGVTLAEIVEATGWQKHTGASYRRAKGRALSVSMASRLGCQAIHLRNEGSTPRHRP
jgi:hypothetical protein